MLSCREISALVSKSMDANLSLGERLAVRIHLTLCKSCRHFQTQSRFIRKLGQAYLQHLQNKP